MVTENLTSIMHQVNALVDETRAQCLWYFREDYYPQNDEEAVRVLEAIERHADVETFKKSARLRQWLLRNAQEPSEV